jgi:hypothetical protein
MATGRQNKLTGQTAEHLVCAELGRRGLIATPFAGNVPTFDVIAVDAQCAAVPIQVKATRSNNWPTDAREWMHLDFDEASGVQRYGGPKSLENAELVYVCVVVREPGDARRDQFFILTKADVQNACVEAYTAWMTPRAWKRPRNQQSFDCRWAIEHIARFEDNWDLITRRLASAAVVRQTGSCRSDSLLSGKQ